MHWVGEAVNGRKLQGVDEAEDAKSFEIGGEGELRGGDDGGAGQLESILPTVGYRFRALIG